jgi:enhancing lycopene biosynthesis protein 2
MKRIGVILSGCGFLDGSEISEAVLTLLELQRQGEDFEIIMMAPNMKQPQVTNHLKNTPQEESRNILEESARIARGHIYDIQSVDPDSLAGLIMPGGFGAAKNLCTFAEKGPQGEVLPAVKHMLTRLHESQKPIAALCISPALVSLVLGQHKIKVTIGKDAAVAGQIQETGARHEECAVDEICVDKTNRIVTTPAYMYGNARLNHIASGIEKCVAQLLSWAR